MARQPKRMLSGLVAVLLIFLLVAPVQAAFDEAYCSGQNTGNTPVYNQQFMSNGNCTVHCSDIGSYAFAVIQYKDCYCSNLIPRQQVPIGGCLQECPGYGAEHCGSKDNGLFIYIQNGQPSGTAPGPSSAQPTSTTSTKASPSQQVSSNPPPSPSESVQVITESGGVITRIVTLTPSPAPSSSSAPIQIKDDDNGPNVGAIAGGVAGGFIGLLLLIGGLVFFLWRRRKQQQEAALDADNGGGSGGITRNTSTMSKAGLLGGASLAGHHYPQRVATNMSSQNSRYGVDQDSNSPVSVRRNSQPLVIDSRLNPNAVMTFAGANLSRESVASLDDSRDYGRQLNVRNPDPHY